MLLPLDPKTNPQLLEATRRSLQTQPDHVVVATFNGITKFEGRRTCELNSSEQEEIINLLTASTLSRVSSSKGSAIPPFYALDDHQGKLRLVLYIASGTAGEEQRWRTRSADLETLAVILSLSGKNHISVPAHLLEQEGNANNDQWIACSLEEIEASSRNFKTAPTPDSERQAPRG